MPRRPRMDLPGIPSHLVQRGNDRQPCFRDDVDRRNYVALLSRLSRELEVGVHAWVLMDNHVHLLCSSAERGNTSRMMQRLGAAYVRHFNDRHERTGTLWEGRFHSCPIDSGRYLWNCHRYVELNPVRAGLVLVPGDYPWSSHRFNALGRFDALTTPGHEYLALGASDSERQAAYRQMFGTPPSDDDMDQVRQHLRHERPLGGEGFTSRVKQDTGVSAAIRPAGRPSFSEGAGR